MSQASKVAEIFSIAGEAFSKLGELALNFHHSANSAPDGAHSHWTEREIEMLRDAIASFGTDIETLSQIVKTKSRVQIKKAMKTKALQTMAKENGRVMKAPFSRATGERQPLTTTEVISTSDVHNRVAAPVQNAMEDLHTINLDDLLGDSAVWKSTATVENYTPNQVVAQPSIPTPSSQDSKPLTPTVADISSQVVSDVGPQGYNFVEKAENISFSSEGDKPNSSNKEETDEKVNNLIEFPPLNQPKHPATHASSGLRNAVAADLRAVKTKPPTISKPISAITSERPNQVDSFDHPGATNPEKRVKLDMNGLISALLHQYGNLPTDADAMQCYPNIVDNIQGGTFVAMVNDDRDCSLDVNEGGAGISAEGGAGISAEGGASISAEGGATLCAEGVTDILTEGGAGICAEGDVSSNDAWNEENFEEVRALKRKWEGAETSVAGSEKTEENIEVEIVYDGLPGEV